MGNQTSNARKSELESKIHEGILRERTMDVSAKYQAVEVLARGSMGYVARVRPVDATGHQEYAVKTFQLDRMLSSPDGKQIEELGNEIESLRNADHPNIVKAYEVYTYSLQMHLVMELCDGGNLYARMPYTEKQAADIIAKLCSAVRYMHKNEIVHRDLKIENILFESVDDDAEIKIINFGMSKKYSSHNNNGSLANKRLQDKVGSVLTMAPEVLQSEDTYTTQSDMWSVGVITYMLLTNGTCPFATSITGTSSIDPQASLQHMINKIINVEYHFGHDVWTTLTDESKTFVQKLIVKDPDHRMTAKQALENEWLSASFRFLDRLPNSTTTELVARNLTNYQRNSALKKIALNVIAYRSNAKEIQELRKLFGQYDKKNTGVISFQEFESALKDSDYSHAELEDIFASIDIQVNGYINYTEFIAASLEAFGDIEEERVAEAFDRLDADDSGFITRQNLVEFLGKGASDEIMDIIRANDTSLNGKISWDEFRQMFQHSRQSWEERQSGAMEQTGLDVSPDFPTYFYMDVVPVPVPATTETEPDIVVDSTVENRMVRGMLS